ncbi:A/G-specific adenine glycosylase [Oscillatoria sp. FACHB-1406]|uniref:A/G-specific adenine glycosylase n=1 Tax=Oscillatoria sp. FACHB-1406 TaxID=2692846 RepID=UPI001681F330|nr:A/G-specific adenine glycosylase [Oscillatoria sp. FACHB-1406]MBD2577105.1 A/G-specific adenine glycosylase [Oscillatoria sp. FACHB-1406]
MNSEAQLAEYFQRNPAGIRFAGRVQWFRRQLTAWGKVNLRDFPWRNTRDAYAIFVAECLLQKTDAATVLPFYKTFLERYPTLSDLAAASVAEVGELLQPLGLFFRAERLVEAAKLLQTQYDGKIPQTEAELLKLPGVGKYTARSLLAHAFAQPASILDTNVARIFERFFGLQGDRVKSRCPILWKATEIALPASNVSRWNLILLDFGAAVCTARNPRCGECPLRSRCQFLNH